TDGNGRTVDFRNAVVILTSNIGSPWIREMAGKGEKAIRDRVMEELRRTFRPEFLNRLDEIILFRELGKEQLSAIVDLMIREVNARLAEREIEIRLTPRAKERLAGIGYDPAYGARPLRRAIQKHVQDPLAVAILKGEIRGKDTVLVDADDGSGFRFDKSG
ncbi:MAG: chaperone clpB 1, partial [Actinobacteria bacterium]|nr:chaperone clpB 1 [Actinomycetota bacterium]